MQQISVYLAPHIDGTRFKVGYSANPHYRFSNIGSQRLVAEKAIYLAVSNAYRARLLEATMHQLLDAYRLPNTGDGVEWFKLEGWGELDTVLPAAGKIVPFSLVEAASRRHPGKRAARQLEPRVKTVDATIRVRPSALEEAKVWSRQLRENRYESQLELATAYGVSPSEVAKTLALARLSDEVRSYAAAHPEVQSLEFLYMAAQVSDRQGSPEALAFLERVGREGLGVRAARKLAVPSRATVRQKIVIAGQTGEMTLDPRTGRVALEFKGAGSAAFCLIEAALSDMLRVDNKATAGREGRPLES